MTYPKRPAPTDFPVAPIIQNRWSPVIFDPKPLSKEQVGSLFEAARWAPSCYNEQPWRFVYTQKGDRDRAMMEGLLNDGNAWAKEADLLIVGFAKKTFARNGKPNAYHLYDTGAAAMAMALEIEKLGLISHQMGGFKTDEANKVLNVPDDFVPASMIAVGYPGHTEGAPAPLVERQEGPRMRAPQQDFAFRGTFGGK